MSQDINEALMHEIASHNIEAVKEWLSKGADPNYRTFLDEDEPHGLLQPTTPLRLVMFCISDALLTDNDLNDFEVIAKILLQYGADPGPALQLAEARYGIYDPMQEETPFMKVWRAVVEG